ncbi:MAG: hypothetical protein AVDCRST_MAG25-3587 [uncultured Rubrobacteraceae bacterium]|uniref:DUF2382 domain-containing protein n=1 Tax=uncultured Rubrobacteraceae bacterium TaxID=349277 RepID=A0A6J4SI00_9ACTN|nr:MAG: hypothetical protein AVDCRST_MAG25-3587 [uncultured Rubrobacteraceae bacterium]
MERDDRNRGISEGDEPRDQEGVNPGDSRNLEERDELRVQRSEEELRAGVREREAGQVGVKKSVRTERESMTVPKKREELSVDRVPMNDEGAPGQIGDGEVSIPVVEEEVVVSKRPVVKEELRIKKAVVEEEEIVEADVRKEEVEIDDASGTGRHQQ